MKRLHVNWVSTIILVFVIFFSFSPHCFSGSNSSPPTWLKKGVYAKYTFPSGHLFLANPTARYGIDSIDFSDGMFRWECVDLVEDFAKLKLTVEYVETRKNGEDLEEPIPRNLSTEVDVNTFNRGLYLQNGSLVGTTTLWLPANATLDTVITIWDVPPDKVTIKPTNTTSLGMSPQGTQPALKISSFANGTINGKNISLHGLWDLNTGVMLSQVMEHEAAFTALNITDWIANGVFEDTNIDLGPPNKNPEDPRLLMLISIPAVFVILSVLIFNHKRKK